MDSQYSGEDIVPLTPEEREAFIESLGGMEAFLDRAFRHQQCGIGAYVCSVCGQELSNRSQLETMLCTACQRGE